MLPDELVHQMHSDYEGGLSLAAVAQRYGKDRRSINEIFARRGIALRPDKNAPPGGRFVPANPMSKKEITAIIHSLTRISVPPILRVHWRHWSWASRRAYIARARAFLKSPHDRPATPFSKNVRPWEYGSPDAVRLGYQDASQVSGNKIKLWSQGVIWRGQLFYWQHKVGYISGGPWTPSHGRSILHRLVWEDHHGRPVPPGHCIYFVDGNRNNLDPRNLALKSRAEHGSANMRKGRARKGRAGLTALLNIVNKKEHNETSRNHTTLQRIIAR